jgi:hypothetical protein
MVFQWESERRWEHRESEIRLAHTGQRVQWGICNVVLAITSGFGIQVAVLL